MSSKSNVATAVSNVIMLNRPGQDGVATVWDGNKYIQCRRMADRSLHCEAAGALMQPSMAHILVPAKVARLAELGWTLDPSFGNYTRIFSPDVTSGTVANAILNALGEVYGADLTRVETETQWLPSESCPPRNGPQQNLAGRINGSRKMAGYTIHACSYTPTPELASQPIARSAQDLIDTYGVRVAGEIGRLRVNFNQEIFIILNTDVGYIQCSPDVATQTIYCEAVSADSWPIMASVLTPERVALLHAAGFADPGRSPNYEKFFRLDASDDTSIAHQLLTVLYDVYGYDGKKALRFITE